MIRPVVATNGHTIYGLTIRGVALLGVFMGVVLAAVVLGVIALSHTDGLAQRNCKNVSGLAGIERTYIQQQQAQTTALLKRGFTFGIPKDQIGPLVKASEANNAAFLASFDALALSNC